MPAGWRCRAIVARRVRPSIRATALVCDVGGRVLADFIVSGANQEHGIISHRSGDAARMLDVPVGTLLRILPNHACATAAQHSAYQVLGTAGTSSACGRGSTDGSDC